MYIIHGNQIIFVHPFLKSFTSYPPILNFLHLLLSFSSSQSQLIMAITTPPPPNPLPHPKPPPRLEAAPLILPHHTTGPTLSRSLSLRPSNCRWRLNGLYPHGLSPFRRSGNRRWRTCMLPSPHPFVYFPYSSPPLQEFFSPASPFLPTL